ncbi:YlmC/YmxH family sporulation protein [Fontibacillus solani]|uniref:Sporulation protein, YlmC/YmxH family n=2 Tax=Fontibacillus TaxID=995014 RepID=A0A1G7FLG4_9BACL|nr:MULTISPECIES: YlmC/YmxH family sporulation protein [Fontibacillus]MBA9085244.1 YlmC/YmxH family sporulation protein [Fontibacillus solani]SDE76767.1 sporulation protein, YlmC/YmxH family [Fontibacillus panacisegetis]
MDSVVRASMKISDFQTKDVINVVDGKRLGHISDLELDLRQGIIEAIVVPVNTKFLGLFGGGTDLIIPWKNIVKIGSDVVLVKMEEQRELQIQPQNETTVYIDRDGLASRRN